VTLGSTRHSSGQSLPGKLESKCLNALPYEHSRKRQERGEIALPCLGNRDAQEQPSTCNKHTNVVQLPPHPDLETDEHCLRTRLRQAGKSSGARDRRRAGDFYLRGRAAGGFGGRRRTDLLTTQTPRRKQAAQSAATHRVGTRAGEALCGLSAAAAITVAGHLGCLLVRKGGEGKRPRWPGLRESSAFDC